MCSETQPKDAIKSQDAAEVKVEEEEEESDSDGSESEEESSTEDSESSSEEEEEEKEDVVESIEERLQVESLYHFHKFHARYKFVFYLFFVFVFHNWFLNLNLDRRQTYPFNLLPVNSAAHKW